MAKAEGLPAAGARLFIIEGVAAAAAVAAIALLLLLLLARAIALPLATPAR
jgi:hypothetical protein